MISNTRQYYNRISSLSLQFITFQIIYTLILIWCNLYTYLFESEHVVTLPLSISFDVKLSTLKRCVFFVSVHKNTYSFYIVPTMR